MTTILNTSKPNVSDAKVETKQQPHVDMNLILNNLWLGSIQTVETAVPFDKHKIRHVINLSQHRYTERPGIAYYHIDLDDVPSSNIGQYFASTSNLIQQALQKQEGVLVHCWAGISRSASVILAYCIKEFGWSLEWALQWVQDRRSIINPNTGFRKYSKLNTDLGFDSAWHNRILGKQLLEWSKQVQSERKAVIAKQQAERMQAAAHLPWNSMTLDSNDDEYGSRGLFDMPLD